MLGPREAEEGDDLRRTPIVGTPKTDAKSISVSTLHGCVASGLGSRILAQLVQFVF